MKNLEFWFYKYLYIRQPLIQLVFIFRGIRDIRNMNLDKYLMLLKQRKKFKIHC